MLTTWNDQNEWLEPDGLGGFASGTTGGIRTRRYHGLLLAATQPPVGRFMLVNGLEVAVTTPGGTFPLSSQRYQGEVVQPDGYRHLEAFEYAPWPQWRYRLPDGTVVEQELFVPHGIPAVALAWRVRNPKGPVRLSVRPLLSGRDYHALHHENPALRFDAREREGEVCWQPYEALPAVAAHANGHYRHQPLWYRRFFYREEALRGFEPTEDLASPGEFTWDLAEGEAALILTAGAGQTGGEPAGTRLARLRQRESQRRQGFTTPLQRAGDGYLVRRGSGLTIIAGYPWFADWGRDSFVSVRGLCLATGRLEEARQILLAWAPFVSQGMLPNRFPDSGEAPEYNSVDASLWYVVAAQEFLQAAQQAGYAVARADRDQLREAMAQILDGYARGTRHGIRLDDDGLLAAGEPGVQLTWMDAKVGDWVVTPRIGKPVEVQALWLAALWLCLHDWPERRELWQRGQAAFQQRFWNPAIGCLNDVVDCDHRRGTADPSCRPNQIFAVGGLPLTLLEAPQARQVVDEVERRLWTPIGLRSLAPGSPGYVGRYAGGPAQRDAAYHQGTVWPWLLGPFVEAWVRVRGGTADARREARRRFFEPLLHHLDEAGLGHISEIADGDAPHMPRGCPFQAWSMGEALRLEEGVLAEPAAETPARRAHPAAERARGPQEPAPQRAPTEAERRRKT